MTGRIGVDACGGPADGEDLERTEALLTSLGRRELSAVDLDDPVAGVLAALVEDVDLQPVPVAVTRRALAVVGTWPGPARPGPPAGSRRRPRVVRLRSPLALVAAGALVVIGSGMSVLAAMGDTSHPLTRLTSVFQESTGGSSVQAMHRRLADKIEGARIALDQGRSGDAVRLIHDVRQEFGSLSATQQRQQADIAHEIAEVEGRLQGKTPVTGNSSSDGQAPATPGGGVSWQRAGSDGSLVASGKSSNSPVAPSRGGASTSGSAVTPTDTPLLSPTTVGTPDDTEVSVLSGDDAEPSPTRRTAKSAVPTVREPEHRPTPATPGRVPSSGEPSSPTTPPADTTRGEESMTVLASTTASPTAASPTAASSASAPSAGASTGAATAVIPAG